MEYIKNIISRMYFSINCKILRMKYKMFSRCLCGNNSGMGVVEVILIILVLVGLVLIFKDRLTGIVNSIFTSITNKVRGV